VASSLSLFTQLFVKAFKKCCVSNGMDGDDDILWNGSEEFGNVRS